MVSPAVAIVAAFLMEPKHGGAATGRGSAALLYAGSGDLLGHRALMSDATVTTRTSLRLIAIDIALDLAVERGIEALEIRCDSKWVAGALSSAAPPDTDDEDTIQAITGLREKAKKIDTVTVIQVRRAEVALAGDQAVAAAFAINDATPPPVRIDGVATRQVTPTVAARVTLRLRIGQTYELAALLRLTGTPGECIETLVDIASEDVAAIWGPGHDARWITDKVNRFPDAWAPVAEVAKT